MLDDSQRTGSSFEQRKLELVRDLLRRAFRDCYHRDFFAFDRTAHVFLIETGRGVQLTLVIPKATFEVPDFGRLCNAQLAETLRLARNGRVVLTPQGLDIHP
jgi:hypothetical protein